MPELAFHVCGAEPLRASAGPAVELHLQISSRPEEQAIQTISLNCQIQIEAARRRYTSDEQGRLRDLFGEPERWGQTLRPLLWTNLTTTVPAFTGSVGIKLAIPCTFDFDVTATKYFYAVEGGAIPVIVLFSGTIFHQEGGQLRAAPIPWNSEARFTMPAGIWKECIDMHHPNTAWVSLRRDNFERLYDFKMSRGLATFDEAIERMLAETMEAKI